ncbi:MAG: four-carbon acid sugar kinase family protein [Deltaproteobacteria bacterium]|nr:four-carbon acid sugar kinase family protein [Deltaproteobacteria bacterium]
MALLGCIADDFTGATDLAGMLVGAGLRTVQTIGPLEGPLPADIDAVVVALKSRTIPAEEAVAQSRGALAWLRGLGCRRFYFKYCSTFDSTDRGNIGPVADALLSDLGSPFTIACPAFPENGRTVFRGHLFVGDVLLSESGMRSHPLTPMTDANLVRVLQRQTRRKVGLLAQPAVAGGAARIRERAAALQAEGVEIAIVDAIGDADLLAMGEAFADLPLLTGGSGVALGLGPAYRARGLVPAGEAASRLPAASGRRAIVSGSCSVATRGQVAAALAAGVPGFAVDPLRLAAGEEVAAEALRWARPLLERGPVLVYATAEPEAVQAVQGKLGRERSGALVEEALAAVARGLVEAGVGRLIVAGGETSGAVVNALGVRALRIGPQIAPGVPWTATLLGRPLSLALKSGNFGGPAFFVDSWEKLP